MTDRVVSVKLRAEVANFTAGLRSAKKSVDDLTKADVPKAAAGYKDLADKAALAGVAITAGLGVAVKRFADFDSAMSAVRANSGATADEMERLRAAALRLGADSQFSATEAAQGINELAKAGIQTADVLGGGLKGALDLAAAGQIGVAQAAETTASAMTQFNLGGDKAVLVADLLANGANKAQGGVGDLGAALGQAGLVASATGLSIEETTAGLTAFASAGLIGSDAGTSFKTMLQRLSAPSGEAAKAMADLGISAYDSQGNFVGLANVAGQLQTSLKDLTPAQRNSALATIFGADAIRAANVLYAEGADGINRWTREVSEQGAAARQAAALTDNLTGDIERLGGAFDSALISTGSGANDALRTLTQGLTSVVETVAKIPGPLLLATGGLAAIALTVPKGISTFREYKATLDSVGLSFEKIASRGPRAAKAVDVTSTALKGLAAATAAVAAAGAISGDISGDLGVQQVTSDILDAETALKALDARFAKAAIFDNRRDSGVQSFGDALRVAFSPDILESIDNTSGALYEMVGGENLSNIAIATQRLNEVDAALSGLVSSGNAETAEQVFAEFSQVAREQGINLDDLRAKFPQYADALAGVSNASRNAAGSGGQLLTVTDDMQKSAEDAKKAWDNLKDAINGLGSPVAQQRAAARDFEAAIDAATASIKENGKTLDEQTDKGRANQSALDAIAAATKAKVLADFELTGSTKDATAAMQDGRDAFIEAARQAGLTKEQAKNLATELGLVPKDVEILVKQSGAEQAAAEIAGAAIDRNSTIWVTRRYRSTDLSSDFQGVGGRALGGAIYGPGSGTSDTAGIFRLSNGEHVWTASEVAKVGGQSAMYAMRAAVRQGRFPGMATGGAVAPQYAPRLQVVAMPGGPSMHSETTNTPIYVAQLNATDATDIRRRALSEAEWRRSTKGMM